MDYKEKEFQDQFEEIIQNIPSHEFITWLLQHLHKKRHVEECFFQYFDSNLRAACVPEEKALEWCGFLHIDATNIELYLAEAIYADYLSWFRWLIETYPLAKKTIKDWFQEACELDAIEIAKWLYDYYHLDLHQHKNDISWACHKRSIRVANWVFSLYPNILEDYYEDVTRDLCDALEKGDVTHADLLYNVGEVDLLAEEPIFRKACGKGNLEVVKFYCSKTLVPKKGDTRYCKVRTYRGEVYYDENNAFNNMRFYVLDHDEDGMEDYEEYEEYDFEDGTGDEDDYDKLRSIPEPISYVKKGILKRGYNMARESKQDKVAQWLREQLDQFPLLYDQLGVAFLDRHNL